MDTTHSYAKLDAGPQDAWQMVLGQLRQLVATLGTLLQEKGVAKPYPGIYMDITRLTGVSRSEDIRQEDFPAVVEFLEKQVRALTTEAHRAHRKENGE